MARNQFFDEIEKIYNDSYLTIFSKPQGLSTMGETPSLYRSDALLLPQDEIVSSKYKKCVPTHRLDKSTGGLVLCSKSLPCEIYFKELFRNKEINKRYTAIVLGYVESPEGTISSIIHGAEAISQYRVILRSRSGSYGWISTVDLWPITGKKHQLRRHMKDIGTIETSRSL
jgi:23S rRNA pseudouridine1911/1915/1917 synthase